MTDAADPNNNMVHRSRYLLVEWDAIENSLGDNVVMKRLENTCDELMDWMDNFVADPSVAMGPGNNEYEYKANDYGKG